ncbi:aspartyl protease-domain-containing protein [Pisolithus thermaeus]|nr:aspartyl protease-domain-containing protein [Pisolithus thermaeus]
MELTFVNDLGDSYVVDADPGYGLEHIMARLEEESGIPVQEQVVILDGVPLVGSKTMREFGVTDNSMLLIRRQRNTPVKERKAGQFIDADRGLQGQIEVASRQRAIMENMEHASEYIPKSFERVTMLYIPAEINGHPVTALVNTYAQQTLISPGCAEACGL